MCGGGGGGWGGLGGVLHCEILFYFLIINF